MDIKVEDLYQALLLEEGLNRDTCIYSYVILHE